MTEQRRFGLGLVGAGSFGQFCLNAYKDLPDLRLAAVADSDREAAERLAGEFGLDAHGDAGELFRRDDVDIVHLATPPFTHHALGLAALRAGKHVLCEKPLATTLDEADELISAARERDRILPVNLILRHHPIPGRVRAVLESGALGRPLRATFENWAKDEELSPDHWFWDRERSGGIFVEHAVHFFDLFDWWFGPAEVVFAHTETRPGTDQEDRVTCLNRHASGVLAGHYHGFDQPIALDRAEHRILCETGDLRVDGWIPTALTVTALVDERQEAALRDLLPEAAVETREEYPGGKEMKGRGRPFRASKKVRLRYEPAEERSALYARGVRELMADQLAYLADRSHRRLVTEENGRAALRVAVRAAERAAGG